MALLNLHRHVAELQDLIVVGGGGAATAAVLAVIEQQRERYVAGVTAPLSITMLERTSHAGAGFPYDPRLHHPVLRVNNPNGGMILVSDKPNDFVDWLRRRAPALKAEYPQLSQIIDDNNSGADRYAPRMLFGLYCRARLKDYAGEAGQLGVTVNIKAETNVVDAMRGDDGVWWLRSEGGDMFAAKNLLLATGHMPSSKFSALQRAPGYFDSPYADLSALRDAPVFILGSGLSAIDAAKLLANQQFKSTMYMISPSGRWPRVSGPATSSAYEMRFLTEENLNRRGLRLAEVLGLFTAELRNATGNPAWTPGAVLRSARQEDSDPVRTLGREIDWVERGNVRGWQLMLGQLWYMPIPLFWKNLDDRDRREFVDRVLPVLLKWTGSMTLDSAKGMARLAEGGQLRLVKSSAEVVFVPELNEFQISTAEHGVLTAFAVINGAGAGVDIDKSLLLRSMAERGLVRRGRFRGGIEMTYDDHIISGDGIVHDNAWGVGAIASNNNIDSNSIEMAAYSAKKFAEQFAQRL